MAQQQSKPRKVRAKAKSGTIQVQPGLVVRIGGRRVPISPVRILGQVGQLRESDRDVLVERYVRGRSSGEIAELLNVKIRTITRRLRKAEERLGKALAELPGVQPTSASTQEPETSNGTEWTQEKDARRCELIDGEIEGTLTADEQTELDQLQSEMLAHRRAVAPLPIEAARKLHAELMEGLTKQ